MVDVTPNPEDQGRDETHRNEDLNRQDPESNKPSKAHHQADLSSESLFTKEGKGARFFRGEVEYVFHGMLGQTSPKLTDYVSDLLVRFIRYDALYKIRALNGNPVSSVVQMVTEAEARIGEAKQKAYRHIGDFALFWSGFYPEALKKLERKAPGMINISNQGKSSYYKASICAASNEESSAIEITSPEVLMQLSDDFEACAYGLREVRRSIEGSERREIWIF